MGSTAPVATDRIPPLSLSRAAGAAVPAMFGYRMPVLPGVHRGLPSPYLTLVFSLSGTMPIDIPVGDTVRSGRFEISVGGLHTRPVLLPRSPTGIRPRSSGEPTEQRGIQLAVHPLAARALFGMPAGELSREVVELDQVVGRQGRVLRERLAGPIDWATAAERVTAWVDDRLAASTAGRPAAELQHAWRLIESSGGRRRIGDVARQVGWSRRHLTARLQAETGLGAKDLARLTRFQRARSRLLARPPLAEVAADCGYADQSHLATEWREFAGCTPGQWIAEELPLLSVHQLDE